MSIFVIQSTQTPMSLLTFREAKQDVAGVVQLGGGDPDDVGAGDAIRQVLRDFNAQRWDYLTVRADDLPLFDHRTRTAGQEGFEGQYTLPARVRDFVSAKVRFPAGPAGTIGGIPLEWVHRNEWDRIVKSESGQGTRYITDFEYGTTAKVELLDWPKAAGLLEMRYYRLIVLPVGDDDRIDVPADGPLEGAMLDLARARVAAAKGAMQKATYFQGLGDRSYTKALGTDRKKFLHDPDWRPRHEWEGNFPAREKRFDFWGTWRTGWRRG